MAETNDVNLTLCELLSCAARGKDELLKTWLWEFASQLLKPQYPDRSEREPFVSEIFEKRLCRPSLWESLRAQCQSGNPAGYIATTVKMGFIDIKRREQRQGTRQVLVAPDDYLLQANLVLEGHASEQAEIELFEVLQDCLEKMDPDNRDLVERRFGFYSHPQTFPQIAQAVAVEEERLKKRLQRLLPKLRECFEKQPEKRAQEL